MGTDVTNPGVTNVADQGNVYGPLVVNQCESKTPSGNAGDLYSVADQGDHLVSIDQCVTATKPIGQGLTPNIDADLASPVSPDTINTTQNTVVGQIYGQGTPINVFV
jgi:hypothetical protein